MTEEQRELFRNGSTWLRADFHLHTNADKEFVYTDDPNFYHSFYIDSLEKNGVHIGVISNHNKFDHDEFKTLRKAGKKRGVFLLPGLELSVKDGANGIHVIAVFDESWIDGSDRINAFLQVAFTGKTPDEYENANGRCALDLMGTIRELERFCKDYFLVFAHVEEKCGLWRELGGGRIEELRGEELFVKRALAFQKVRTHDVPDRACRVKVKKWLEDVYPAEVEGSDPKSIEEIGKGEACFLKVGAFSFDAVKFALMDNAHRLSDTVPQYSHSHIGSISFEGGTLSGTTVDFSPELNTMIGIRGSGKSSILEAIRYVLDIPFGEKAGDREYKNELVRFTMGSGGKAVIRAVDRYGRPYEIRRIWGEPPSVFVENRVQPGVSIRETVLHKPVYFGQRDLSNSGEGFEKDLVEKMLGTKLNDVRRRISEQKAKVVEIIERMEKIANTAEQMDEQTRIKQDTEFRLALYKEHGVEEKLQRQLDFDQDIRTMSGGVQLVEEFIVSLRELLARHEDELRNFPGYRSKCNPDLFTEFEAAFSDAIRSLEIVKSELSKTESTRGELASKYERLLTIRRELADEFAEVERKLAEDLKESGNQNVSSEEFLKLKQKLARTEQLLALFEKQQEQNNAVAGELAEELQKLRDLWHEEFQTIMLEMEKIVDPNSALKIKLGYKEDKKAFLEFMKSVYKGSSIREATLQNVVERYPDFIGIYTELENAQQYFGSNPQLFTEFFLKNLKTLLTFQTPNLFSISYRGKELQQHSLGQRASALILFVLSRQENDVIIIDQPEDDLDNQTIYEDVVKLVRSMKPRTQFILATHNPNIPVLGDAEQIHACSFADDVISVRSGAIDDPAMQQAIVDIMEGGREAFNRRKEIYTIWKQ